MGRAGPGPVDKPEGLGGRAAASSGKLWLCLGVRCITGSTRRGLTRGAESEEGGERVHEREDGAEDGERGPSLFDVFWGSKNRYKNGTQKVI